LVEAWAELHQGELAADWELLQAGRPPKSVAPLRAMRQAGRARVDAVFDTQHHLRAIESLFDEILAERT